MEGHADARLLAAVNVRHQPSNRILREQQYDNEPVKNSCGGAVLQWGCHPHVLHRLPLGAASPDAGPRFARWAEGLDRIAGEGPCRMSAGPLRKIKRQATMKTAITAEAIGRLRCRPPWLTARIEAGC